MIKIDNQNKALNEDTEIENSEDTTPVSEETTEEVVEEPVEAESTEEAEVVTETKETEDGSVEEPKKGASARIRELNTKKKEAEERAQSLEEKLAQLTRQDTPEQDIVPTQPVQDEPLIKPGEEIDALELDRRLRAREQKVLQQADAKATLRAKQSEAITRINSEAQDSVRKYPELDPDSEDFNKDLSDTVTEAVEAFVKVNPYTASVKTFVDKLMKPYKGAVAKEVGKASETLVKQASQAAQRPVSIRKTEKTASEKTIAELEQELDFVQS